MTHPNKSKSSKTATLSANWCVWLELLTVVFFVRVKVVFMATASVVAASESGFPFGKDVEFAKGKGVSSLVLLELVVVLTSSPEHRVQVMSKRTEKFIVLLISVKVGKNVLQLIMVGYF